MNKLLLDDLQPMKMKGGEDEGEKEEETEEEGVISSAGLGNVLPQPCPIQNR